jgi:hypothetical protein
MAAWMGELNLSRDRGPLYSLREHYALLGQADPQAWRRQRPHSKPTRSLLLGRPGREVPTRHTSVDRR